MDSDISSCITFSSVYSAGNHRLPHRATFLARLGQGMAMIYSCCHASRPFAWASQCVEVMQVPASQDAARTWQGLPRGLQQCGYQDLDSSPVRKNPSEGGIFIPVLCISPFLFPFPSLTVRLVVLIELDTFV